MIGSYGAVYYYYYYYRYWELYKLYHIWPVTNPPSEIMTTMHHQIQGSLNKFPDFFRMGTFIASAHKTLVPFELISSGYNTLVPFQQLLEDPMEVLLWERVSDLRHSLFHLLNCLDSFSLSLGNNQKSQGARSGL